MHYSCRKINCVEIVKNHTRAKAFDIISMSARDREKGTDMTTKYSFFIGLNDKDSKVQIVETITASNIVNRVFIDNGVDGATITSGKGIYKHANGEIVVEETLIVQVYEFEGIVDVRKICTELKSLLNQESIAVEKHETNSQLY